MFVISLLFMCIYNAFSGALWPHHRHKKKNHSGIATVSLYLQSVSTPIDVAKLDIFPRRISSE